MAEENSGSGVTFFLTGLAVGAALGVLFAPREGSRTREQLADWLEERREQGTDLLDKVKDESSAKRRAVAAAAKAASDAFRHTSAKRHNGEA